MRDALGLWEGGFAPLHTRDMPAACLTARIRAALFAPC